MKVSVNLNEEGNYLWNNSLVSSLENKSPEEINFFQLGRWHLNENFFGVWVAVIIIISVIIIIVIKSALGIAIRACIITTVIIIIVWTVVIITTSVAGVAFGLFFLNFVLWLIDAQEITL